MHSASNKIHVFRLAPRQDLKKSIISFSAKNRIRAGVIVTCVGSLEQYNLRFANEQEGRKVAGHFEIVSLTGTVSDSYGHLHLAISDKSGKTVGGHLLDENIVYTTAEIAIVELSDLSFERQTDPAYGYAELVIKTLKNDE
jgi:uncharacterized protein